MKLTHFKEASNSPYLGAWDLPNYEDINLTIKEVRKEMSKGLKEDGLFNIVYFKEPNVKPMLLNSTNSKSISRVAKSPYLEKWAGVEITLFVQRGVKAFGELHDALRVRPVTTVKTKQELTPGSKLWDKAKERAKAGASIEVFRKHYIITDENFKELCK